MIMYCMIQKKNNDVIGAVSKMKDRDFYLILEKDYVNRAVYPPSDSLLPQNMKLVIKDGGYELYEK